MTNAHFARVWKATGYCRGAGILEAYDGIRNLWLPIERPVAADVKVQVGVTGHSWTCDDLARQSWADEAKLIASHAGLEEDMRVSVHFRTYSPRDGALLTDRAAALAAVLGVAKALEHPMHPSTLTKAEKATGVTTGLAYASTGIANAGSFEVLDTERYLWVYARPLADIDWSEPFGDIDALAKGKGSIVERVNSGLNRSTGTREAMLEALKDAQLEPLTIVGGAHETHPVAALLPKDFDLMVAGKAASAQLRAVLGPTWSVGMAQSAVPSM